MKKKQTSKTLSRPMITVNYELSPINLISCNLIRYSQKKLKKKSYNSLACHIPTSMMVFAYLTKLYFLFPFCGMDSVLAFPLQRLFQTSCRASFWVVPQIKISHCYNYLHANVSCNTVWTPWKYGSAYP